MGKKLGEYQTSAKYKAKKQKEIQIVKDFENYKFKTPTPHMGPVNELPELTPYQDEMIQKFKVPKIYVLYYKFYKYFFKYALFFGFLSCIPIALLQNEINAFNILKGILIGLAIPAAIGLVVHLYKFFYTKRYAKNISACLDNKTD
jgi:hypothetical protein